MALIQPNGIIRVLQNTGLNNTYQHTRYFASVSAQTTYFSGKTKYTFTDQSYSRPSRGFIRVQRKATDLYDCDYLMFQNSEYGNKWFYAFITSVDYISNNTSQINFELDDIQSWFFEYDLGYAYVKRCHTRTDSVGEHLEPEPVSFSDYKYDELSSLILDNTLRFLTFSPMILPYTGQPEDITVNPNGTLCGLFQGLFVQGWTSGGLKNVLQGIKEEVADSIVAIVGVPNSFIMTSNQDQVVNGSPYSQDVACMQYSNDFEGYVPENNKMYTYPYNLLYVTTMSGQSQDLRWEYFEDSTDIKFNLTLAIQPNPELVVAPLKYAGGQGGSASTLIYPNYDYKIVFTDFPRASWVGDYFRSWLANTGIKEILSAVSGAVSASTHGVGAGIGSAVVNGAVAGIDFANAMYHPNIVHGGGGGGNAILAKQGIDIKCYRKFVNRDDAKRIDKFFTTYGYAVNDLIQVPRHNRTGWTYVQTANCTVRGNAPADVLANIATIHNTGITYWSGYEIGDYNHSNSLLS